MNDMELVTHSAASLVPSGYAEKAMASLMQLHTELMEEKERRVDLYRRMTEKDQAIAELRMYVKMLEEKAAARKEPKPPGEPAAVAPAPIASRPERVAETISEAPQPVASARPPRVAPPVAVAPRLSRPPPPLIRRPLATDGWKTW